MAKGVFLKKNGVKYYPAPYMPIGSIYLSINKTNPSSIFGGTWQLVSQGAYLIGYNPNNEWFNVPGANKGTNNTEGNWNTEDTILTIDQIPAHNHKITYTMAYGANDPYRGLNYGSNVVGNFSDKAWSDNTGGGKGHKHFHVSPFYTVCVWLRTA